MSQVYFCNRENDSLSINKVLRKNHFRPFLRLKKQNASEHHSVRMDKAVRNIPCHTTALLLISLLLSQF